MDNLAQETTLIVLFSVIMLVVGGGVLFLVYLYQKKQTQFLYDKQQLELSFRQEILKTQLETQEQTFLQIGEELHDNNGQLLSSAHMLINITERSMDLVPDTLKTANLTLAKAIQDLRMLTKSLNREWLHQFNVIENLKAEIERINATRTVNVSFESSMPDLPLEPEARVMLFRIIQEALHNSMKHSEAKNIAVSLKNDPEIEVRISDDGKGFRMDTGDIKGIGLLNMNHRTSLLGGTISWTSFPSRGTTVIIRIPVQNQDHEN